MTSTALDWAPSPYETNVEYRAGGSFLLRPRLQLDSYPIRITDELERWAAQAPDRVFVAQRAADGQWETVSYAQALARVQRLAAGLVEFDLSPERPIAIVSGNSIEHLLLGLAAAWIGVPYVPISPAYAQPPSDLSKLRFVFELMTPGMIASFDPTTLARAVTLAPADAAIVGNAMDIAGRAVTTLAQLGREPSPRANAAHDRTNADTIAKFLLTSGSTGQPKAVITTHRMLCSNAMMLREALPFVLNEPPVLLDWLPWNHVFGGSHNVGLVLFNGGSLYIDDGKPTPRGFAATVKNLREIAPTVYFNVPKGFDMLVQHLEADAELRRSYFSRLRSNFFAGASLSQHTWDRLDALSMAERGVRIPMLCGLGATETGPSVTFTTPAAGRSGVIGLPAMGCTVKLVPVDGKLEIRVSSPSVTPGYWRRPELTSAAFDEEGFYRLGDAVRLVDRNDPARGLIFDGRLAEDFKLASGTWVSVGPLRVRLLAALAPLIQDVVIAGLNRDYLTALLVPDAVACAAALQLDSVPDFEQLAKSPELLRMVRDKLKSFAAQNTASSICVRRVALLTTPLDLDRGEITDKGYINQRAVLAMREPMVESMYSSEPPAYVVRIDEP